MSHVYPDFNSKHNEKLALFMIRYGNFSVLTGIPFFKLCQDHFSAWFFIYNKWSFPKHDFPVIFLGSISPRLFMMLQLLLIQRKQFSNNSVSNASKFLDNREEMFLISYMYGVLCCVLKTSAIQYCAARINRVNRI